MGEERLDSMYYLLLSFSLLVCIFIIPSKKVEKTGAIPFIPTARRQGDGSSVSIIFEKEFEYIPLKNGRGIRIENLLSLIHMNGYICDGSMDRRILLEPYINRSKEWIREIVEGFHSEKERHYDGAI